MDTLIAGVPITVLVVLLVARVRAAIAVAGAIVCALAAAWRFPVDPAAAVEAGAALGATTLTVAIIMFAGMALAKLQQLAGAQQALSRWLEDLSFSRERAVLFLGVCLVPLIESLIGWGMGVIFVLPLLGAIGLPTIKAVQISLLGLSLCPWGSFAPALLLMSETTGLSVAALGTATAWSNCVVIAVLALTTALVSGGRAQLGRCWPELLCTWLAMSGVLVAANALLAPPLGGVVSALAGALVLGMFARAERSRVAGAAAAAAGALGTPRRGAARMPGLAKRGLIPFAVVLFGLGAATFLAPLSGPGWLRAVLLNPAFWIMLALVCAPASLRMTATAVRNGLAESFRVFVPAAVVTLLFIGLGMLLGVNGMGAELARGATALGGAFVPLVPLMGLASGWVTGSNTASVAMLSQPLQFAALGLGADPVAVLGLHTAATGAGITMNPARAVLAIETARLLPPAESGTQAEPGGGRTSLAAAEPAIRLGRVLAPLLWANAAIAVLLVPVGVLRVG